GPPLASIRCRRPSAKNAIDAPSGDQKGEAAFTVPGSACASASFIARTQSTVLPVESGATNATRRPSGEIPSRSAGAPLSGDGGRITALYVRPSGSGLARNTYAS